MTIKLETSYFKILNAKGCGYITLVVLKKSSVSDGNS